METFELAAGLRAREVRISASPLSIPQTEDQRALKRITYKELEYAYNEEELLFNGINLIADMGANFRTLCETKKILKRTEEIFAMSKPMLNWNVTRFMCMYGTGFLELVPNVKGNKIVRLDLLDTKRMDYQKDNQSRILLDSSNNPMGFVQRVDGYGYNEETKARIKNIGGVIGIPFPRERIAVFPLYETGDGFYATGMIEPVYETALAKRDIERALRFNANKLIGILWGQAGNERHEPTMESTRNLLTKLTNSNYTTAIATPYYEQIKIISGSEGINVLPKIINSLKDSIVSPIGPNSLISGRGEDTNRSTLAVQLKILKERVNTIQTKISWVYNTQIWPRIGAIEGWSEIPVTQGLSLDIDDLNALAERYERYLNSGALLADDGVRKKIRELEGLPDENPSSIIKPPAAKQPPKEKPDEDAENKKDDGDDDEQ